MKKNNFGRVGVFAGGPSNEREISLRSGKAVYDALIQEGIEAVFLDVQDDICDIIKNNNIDVAFIALHGRFGEDGSVQKILEDAHIPYTGSGVEASRLALDKVASKQAFRDNGIPTPDYIVFDRDHFYAEGGIESAYKIGIPAVVKPQLEGSSIGLSIAKDKNSLKEAIDKAFEYGDKILIEEYVSGRELTVGILDDEPLPAIEIITREGVYDYKAKYNDPQTKYLVPAPLGKEALQKAQALGKRSHTVLGCRSFSRVDMIMDKSGEIFVLEVNTIPGMTERSLLPKAAGAAGVTFNKLCTKFIENALNHTREKNETTKSV